MGADPPPPGKPYYGPPHGRAPQKEQRQEQDRIRTNPTVLAAILAILAVLGLTAYSVAGNDYMIKSRDVHITSCTGDGLATTATVQATNYGTSAANYDVTVNFTDSAGVRIGTIDVHINGVQPGHTAQQDAVLPSSSTDVGCHLNTFDKI
jgi:hypothetical protein